MFRQYRHALVAFMCALILSSNCNSQETVQFEDFLKQKEDFKTLDEFETSTNRVFSNISQGDLENLTEHSNRWLRVQAMWILTKRSFVNSKEHENKNRVEYFLGFLRGNLACRPPEIWEKGIRNADVADGGNMHPRRSKQKVSNIVFNIDQDKIMIKPPRENLTDGTIERYDQKGNIIWTSILWQTNTKDLIGAPHEQYIIRLRSSRDGKSLFVFGIASNYIYIKELDVQSGKSSGYVYLDCSGVFK